ncbi:MULTISPECIES: response regulator [unclassified Corallococcus]|uniref:response regulator n=1 Tax=unclassified Corallococcus TaxID=2685029 RepID=UPI001A8C1A85|nr:MULTISPECIES: DNA-binding response regulator [unclassified Corallococcus]MBN9686777.1 DNA-binding response regulator [Corallococcus sp. NCSPR001]WAS81809.1 DNA-binding response regulator [Corallococcus sp. NCRR]
MVAYLHAAPPPETSAPAGGRDALDLPGGTGDWVLLVGETARPAVAEALAREGFEPVLVDGARAALARLGVEAGGTLPGVAPTDSKDGLPRLVIIDADLPDGDGFSLCGVLRADPKCAHLPVLLVAKLAEEFHRDLAAGVGADEYLVEPVDARDVAVLARLKAGRRGDEDVYDAHTSTLPLVALVRALLSGVRSGRVVLSEDSGTLFFRHGLVVDAAFHGERGSLAFRRLLCFGAGAYTVTFGPELQRGSFSMDRPFICEQVVPGLERFEQLRVKGLPLAARLTVDFNRLAQELPSLPEDVEQVVRLFDGRRTVRAMLLECRFPEALAYEAATRLFMLGVLVPAILVEERERARESAGPPRLFEPVLAPDSEPEPGPDAS